ncbi:IS66 family insertion sequence element accessory protein TnpA [Niallia sp. Marseille-Q9988]
MTKKPNLELRKEWEQRISDYKASGQSQAKWCEDNRVSYHQFGYWKRRLNSWSQ